MWSKGAVSAKNVSKKRGSRSALLAAVRMARVALAAGSRVLPGALAAAALTSLTWRSRMSLAAGSSVAALPEVLSRL